MDPEPEKGLAAEGRTVFASSHLMSEMALTAEHLIVIGRGRLLADTTAAEFINANWRPYVRIRTPEPERMRDALAMAGIPVRQAADGALEAYQADPAKMGEPAAANGPDGARGQHAVGLAGGVSSGMSRSTGPEVGM